LKTTTLYDDRDKEIASFLAAIIAVDIGAHKDAVKIQLHKDVIIVTRFCDIAIQITTDPSVEHQTGVTVT